MIDVIQIFICVMAYITTGYCVAIYAVYQAAKRGEVYNHTILSMTKLALVFPYLLVCLIVDKFRK